MTGLTEDTGYGFEVRAIDSDLDGVEGIGPESSVTGTPTMEQTAPDAMTNVKYTVTGVSEGAGGTVTFTWEDPGDDFIDKYQYRYDATENNPGEGNWDQDWEDIPVTPVTNNNKDMTSWGPVGIHGSGIATYYELRAINTDRDPDLPGLVTPITVARSNTPAATTPPPTAPTNLAISAGSDSLTVSWDIPATDMDENTPIPDITNWKWERQEKQNNGDYDDWAPITDLACPSSSTTRYCSVRTGADVTGTWSFKIRAVDDKGTTSDTTDDVAGPDRETETVAVGTPDAITDLAVEQVTEDVNTEEKESEEQLSLTWTLPDNVTLNDHEYRYRKGLGVWSGWTTTGSTAFEYTVTGLDSGTTYEFQVRAVAGTGGSALRGSESNSAVGTTAQGPAPGAPAGLTAATGLNAVTLSWTAPVVDDENSAPDFYAYQQTTSATGDVALVWEDPGDLDIANYQYRQTSGTTDLGEPDFSGAAWQDIASSDKDTTSHTVTSVDLSTTHFFEVQYVKSDTTTGSVAVTRTDTLHFTGAAEVRMEGGGSITSGAALGLSAGTVYYFRVRAGNVNGDGDWSDSASATPRAADAGVWTYDVQFDPPAIRPGNTSRLQVVATFTAAESDRDGISSLIGGISGFGALSATLPDGTPAGVGFDDGNPSTALDLSTSHTVAAVDCSGASFTLTCKITFGERLRAESSGSYTVTTAVTSPFSITPVVNGINGIAASPTSTTWTTPRSGWRAPRAATEGPWWKTLSTTSPWSRTQIPSGSM